jgi:uncharacterized phiE125 gp8 family phage protein
MNLKRTIAPATLISLADAKGHLRVDGDDEDAVIAALVDAATQYLDGWQGILGRALMPQTWELYLDRFPASGAIRIPLGPLLEVQAVDYAAADDGAETTVPVEDYVVDTVSPDGWIVPAGGASWPATLDAINAVKIRFVAGYPDAASVPAPIKAAALLLVGNWFENREAATQGAMSELPMAVNALLAPYRRVMF